jgi:hemolysin activation/secretion protein
VSRLSKSALPTSIYLALHSATSLGATAPVDGPVPGEPTQRVQQQRLDAMPGTGTLADTTTPRTEPPSSEDLTHLPLETPCFVIDDVVLKGNPWPALDERVAPVKGQCIGAQGVKLVQQDVANALIAQGYITTRVTVPEQSLASGTLTLEVTPGRTGEIRSADEAIGWLPAALPTHEGAVLNQHAIDQALENIRRLPSQADASFDIVPGAQPGESDLVLHPGTGKRWQAAIGYDNAGVNATGKDELSASIAIDSPLGLYDRLLLAGLTNAGYAAPGKGSNQASASYSVPFGYAMLSVDANRSSYLQSVTTNYGVLQYYGEQKNVSVKLSGVVQRNAHSRTELSARFLRAFNQQTVSGTQLDLLSRDVYAYELGASHRRYIGNIQAELFVGWRETLPGISKTPGFAVDAPNFNGHEQIETASLNVLAPFRLGGQPFAYQFTWNTQNARTPVTSPDYFTIGTRYSVRGFDQQTTLAAESGWTVSNELDWYAPTSLGVQALYTGIDAGRVRGTTARYLPGNTLVGMVAGVRGTLAPKNRLGASLNYDVSLGWPLYKPKSFPNSSPTLLVQITALV